MEESHSDSDIRGYWRILKQRKWIVLLTILTVTSASVAYSFLRAPVYQATATVLVPQQQASAALNVQNAQLQDPAALQRSLADEETFAAGDLVKRMAEKKLGYEAKVRIGASSTADVITFSSASGRPSTAAAIANAYANSFISARRVNQVDLYAADIQALQSSISTLKVKAATLSPSDPQLTPIQNSINSLTQTVEETQAATAVASQTSPTILTAATPPVAPSSPKPVRDILLGVLVGVILGAALSFLTDHLDDSLRSRDAAERAAGGAPILALLPMVESWRRDDSRSHLALQEDPGSQVAEAYRTLRTALQFVSIDEPKSVIAITSSVVGEGKSTTIANLALSFTAAGQRVILVSGDLRRPSLHKFFGFDNNFGLTSVLLGQVPLQSALRTVPGEPNLRILASGPVPPNPAELLAMNAIGGVIDELARDADIVLLDCPPCLPVTDALLISRLVDGVAVIASVNSTSTKQLGRTIELLGQVNAPLLGIVLNRVSREVDLAYGYGYGYGYGHGDMATDSSRRSEDVADRLAATGISESTNRANSQFAKGEVPAARSKFGTRLN